MMVLKLMKEGKSKQLFDVMTDFIDQAVSECKAGSLSWLLSSLDFPQFPADIHAYGSVIGTGNAVVSWVPKKGGGL
jgi:2-aminophenol/2-amino-5-chlorophenol 1,6-dioxygenase beta subunit